MFCQKLKSNIEKESPTASRGGQGHFGKYWCRIHVPLSCYLSPLVIIIISYTVKFLISRKIYERRILNQTILLVTCVASKIEYILWITVWKTNKCPIKIQPLCSWHQHHHQGSHCLQSIFNGMCLTEYKLDLFILLRGGLWIRSSIRSSGTTSM